MTRSPGASRRLGFALAIALLAGGSYAIASTWTNLREVEPGKFYRSGQLSDAQLRSTIDAFGIKTIINLRTPSLNSVSTRMAYCT